MPGRIPKPRAPSQNREKLLGQLRSDIGSFRSRSTREAVEERLGRPITEHEWLAIAMAGEPSRD